ncbi:MAG TPA: serine/threonine-protein kinase [Actinocrinis sp.]|nr:serine/threonine-protein kinase [Actinocrinis sp.]
MTGAEGRTPPTIPGYEFLRDLGAGGYSVVYLYRQASLNREVAVKVLRDFDLPDVVRERFTAEATAMVQLGNHPNIVDVLDTGIASDGSRYLIMRYYPGGNLAQRSARRGLPVAEVVDIGLKLADAVKTVHAARLVHRDIKPANVLIDDANRNYRLSDFGIAGQLVSGHAGDAFGISVPWSAPEVVLGETGGSVASDVYSLGATLWHLLIGQSPFRLNDGDNSRTALEKRICAGQLPPMPRADVPRALTDLLTGMMAVTWYARPSLADVIRDLAAITAGGAPAAQFRPPPTYGGQSAGPVFPPAADQQPDDADRTSIRRGPGAGRPATQSGGPAANPADQTIAAQYRFPEDPRSGTGNTGGTSGTGNSGRRTLAYGEGDSGPAYGPGPNASQGSGYQGTYQPVYPSPFQENRAQQQNQASIPRAENWAEREYDNNQNPDSRPDTDDQLNAPARRRVLPAAIGVVVLAAALGVALLGGGGGKPVANPTTPAAVLGPQQQNPGQLGQDEPPGPVAVTATRISSSALQFSWTYSDELANDSFQWQTQDGSQSGTAKTPTLALQDSAGVQLCVEVKVVRADGSNGSVDWSQPGCGQ